MDPACWGDTCVTTMRFVRLWRLQSRAKIFCESTRGDDDDDDIEAKRAALETLISSESRERGFRFADQQQPPPAVVDDVGEGLRELKAIGGSVGGNFILLIEICLGGLTSPIGLAAIALFALLYASGEFGSPLPFITSAPSEGEYYRVQDSAQLLGESLSAERDVDDTGASAWLRLRGGATLSRGIRHSVPGHPRTRLPASSRPSLSTLARLRGRGIPTMESSSEGVLSDGEDDKRCDEVRALRRAFLAPSAAMEGSDGEVARVQSSVQSIPTNRPN